jgi:hypothetical protein
MTYTNSQWEEALVSLANGGITATATNASVGTDGSTGPASSTQVGGQDGSGNLQPLQVDASKNLKVNIASGSITASNPSVGTDSATVPGSETLIGAKDGSGNLKAAQTDGTNLLVKDANSAAMKTDLDSLVTNTTGLATAANQTTSNTSLSTIATNTTGLATHTDATGIKSDLDSIVTNTTGIATAANQATGNTNTSNTATNTSNINTATGAKGDSAATDSTSSWSLIALLKGLYAKLAGTLTVSGTVTSNAGTNLNTSALALESGGNLASAKSDLDTLAGAVSSNKMQVSQQAAGSASATLQNAATGAGNGSTLNVLGMSSCVFTVTGTFTGLTVNFEGSEDGSTYSALTTAQLGTTTLGSTTTSTGLFECSVGSLQLVRARLTASTPTGTLTVTAHAAPVTFSPRTVNANLVSGSDIATVEGTPSDTAVTGDNTGTHSAKLRGLNKILADIWDSANHRIKVDGSGVTQPVSGTFWQSTQPVSGTVTNNPGAATSGGTTPYHLISAASDNSTNVKGSAGQIYDMTLSNTNAAARYFKLYDKATAPASSDTPKRTIQIPANATVICAFPVGMSFASGIGFRATTGLADADTGSVGASDLSIDLGYK